MTFRTFMNSIGNAFKTGWNNGNIQKGMKITGATAFGVGAIGVMANEMKNMNNSSIFGGCCYGRGMLGGCGVNPFAMNPYGMSNFGMGMSSYGMMGTGNVFDNMGMLNNYALGTSPYLTQAGNQAAFEWGRNLMTQYQMNPQFSGTFNNNTELTDEQIDKFAPERNNQRVVADPNADTKLGDAFEEGTDALNKDKDKAEAVKLSDDKFSNENKDGYVSNLGKVAESYIAKIGSSGTISEDDFIDHEIEKYKEDNPNLELSEQNETFLRNKMKLAFAKLDLNRDGEIDKNEMTSALATFDTGGKGIGTSNTADGEITSAEYRAAQSALSANNTTFATNNWNNYQQLFGKQDDSE